MQLNPCEAIVDMFLPATTSFASPIASFPPGTPFTTFTPLLSK